VKLNDNCDKIIVPLEYVGVIKNIIYVMHCTKLNIFFYYISSYQDIQASQIQIIKMLLQESLIISKE
jgi:hypothetical protein